MAEIIFIAKPTWMTEKIYPGHRKFFQEFYPKLKEYHEVEVLDLPDIWVRDFLPVQNQKTGQLYQMFFDPRYANYTPQFNALIRHAVHNCFPHAQSCDLRIDGGNMALNPKRDTVFCFEKQTIFRKSKPEEKQKAEQALKTALGVNQVVWLPRETDDKICHIDGYIQYLEDVMCISDYDYWHNFPIWLKRNKILKNFVKDENFIDFPYEIDENDYLSAKGIYVNFLETSRAVFLPQYNLHHDDKALEVAKLCTKKPIVKIDCSEIAEYGGAVHCLTREYNAPIISY